MVFVGEKKLVAACNRCVRWPATAAHWRRLQEPRRPCACGPGSAGLLNNALVGDGRCELRSVSSYTRRLRSRRLRPWSTVTFFWRTNKRTNERFRMNETNETNEWTNERIITLITFLFKIDAFSYQILEGT